MPLDEAIVLRRHRYGESSLVAHVLSRHHGRVALLAKGAYRPKSAFSGVLDLFDTLELDWRASSRSELAVLRAGRPLVLRRALSADLLRYRQALAAVELADLAARPGQAESRLFEVLVAALDRLCVAGDPELARLAYDLHFLDALGLAPALENCASCGRVDLEPEGRAGTVAFSSSAGGALCERCARSARADGARVGRLPRGVLRIANALRTADDRTLATYRLSPEKRAGVRDFVARFLEYHLEAQPRTRRPLRRKPGAPATPTAR